MGIEDDISEIDSILDIQSISPYYTDSKRLVQLENKVDEIINLLNSWVCDDIPKSVACKIKLLEVK